jgi:hypothetical protein
MWNSGRGLKPGADIGQDLGPGCQRMSKDGNRDSNFLLGKHCEWPVTKCNPWKDWNM